MSESALFPAIRLTDAAARARAAASVSRLAGNRADSGIDRLTFR